MLPNSLGASKRFAISSEKLAAQFKTFVVGKYGKCEAGKHASKISVWSGELGVFTELTKVSVANPAKVTLWLVALDETGRRTCSEGLFLTPRVDASNLDFRPSVKDLGHGLYAISFAAVTSFVAKVEVFVLMTKTDYASKKEQSGLEIYLPRTASGLQMDLGTKMTST
jgi:hypothetical protein